MNLYILFKDSVVADFLHGLHAMLMGNFSNNFVYKFI